MQERKEGEAPKPPEERKERPKVETPPPTPRRGIGAWLVVLIIIVVALATAAAWFSIQWKQAREEARRAQERIRAMCLQSVASAAVDLDKAAAQAKALNIGEALTRIERASRKIRDAASMGDKDIKARLVPIQDKLNKLPNEFQKEIKKAAERAASRIAELAKKVREAGGGAPPPVKVEVQEE